MSAFLRPPIARSGDSTRVALRSHLLAVWRAFRTGQPLGPNSTHLVSRLTEFQPEALSRSFSALLQRHPILTARVEESQFGVYLRSDIPSAPRLEVIDLEEAAFRPGSGPTHEHESYALQVVHAQVWKLFDFDADKSISGSLVRCFLVIVSKRCAFFGVVVHHVIADFLSMVIVARDLTRLYKDEARGVSRRYSEPGVSFIAHLIDLYAWLDSAQGKLAIANCHSKMHGIDEFLLPADVTRRDRSKPSNGVARFHIPAQSLAELRDFCREYKTTLFAALLAAQFVAIMKANGKREGIIHIAQLGRDQAQLYNVVGWFATDNPIRLSADGGSTFCQLLLQIQQQCKELSMQPPISHGTSPLGGKFSLFNYLDCMDDAMEGLFSLPLSVPWPEPVNETKEASKSGGTHCLFIERSHDRLTGFVGYCPDVHSEDLIRTFVVDMLTMLRIARRAPDLSLDEHIRCLESTRAGSKEVVFA